MSTNTARDLFSPITLGQLELANRIWLAPLTRTRAGLEHIPNALMAEYYAQHGLQCRRSE
jgi:N-ethylmaleimide reductase